MKERSSSVSKVLSCYAEGLCSSQVEAENYLFCLESQGPTLGSGDYKVGILSN